MSELAVGDLVRLWIGPPKRGGWRYGEIVGVNLGRPGVQVRFDAALSWLLRWIGEGQR